MSEPAGAPLRIDAATRRVSLDPGDIRFYDDPYPAYRALHAAAPTFFWEQYGFWCFSRHADVSALLRDRRFGRQVLHLADRESLGWPERPAHLAPFDSVERHSLLELEPPEHTRLRSLVNRAFVSRQVERLAPRIEVLANTLIDGFEGEGEAELISAFATPLAVEVIAQWIGVPSEMAPQLLDWSHRMVAMYAFHASRETELAAALAARDFAAAMRERIAERRRAPREDLISRLIEAEADGGRLSEDEMASTLILLLNAGHEATVHSLGNSVKALLQHRADLREPERAVEELLRFDPPLHLFTRYALEDLEIDGVRLKLGDRIGLLLGAANRDPLAFPDPDRLDLERDARPHVAFGAGVHFCVGAPLARLELRIGLAALTRRLPRMELMERPKYRDSFHFHGLEALAVRL